MANASDLIEALLRKQNPDGGWGHQGKNSWTEPTALAVMALNSCRASAQAQEQGRRWLIEQQRLDGGWAPTPAVETSTAVTSVACLALSGYANTSAHRAAVVWILNQIKPDLNPIARFEYWLQQMPPEESTMGGSSWYPGTAAWISPTVMSVLALADARNSLRSPPPEILHQLARGKRYIFSRQCEGGGWNHGGTHFRGSGAPPYPEMTGMALLALDGEAASELHQPLAIAEQMAFAPASNEGQSWLKMALTKQKRTRTSIADLFQPRTTREICLELLADTCANGNNRFMTSTV